MTLQVEWSPDAPRIERSRPRRKFIKAYQAARRDFFEEVATTTNGTVLVVDSDVNLTRMDRMETIRPATQH
jgi:hypothetical protein